MYRRRQNQRTPDPMVMLLFLQLAQKVNELPWKPPVTLVTMAANVLIYFKDLLLPYEISELIPSVREGCIQPYAIVMKGQWARLIWSAFLHLDDMHLYYNMTSLLLKGAQLERRMGSVKFAMLLAELLVVSHGIMAGSCAWLGESNREYRSLSRGTCAAGFSAVLFALKYVLTYNEDGWSYPMGLNTPIPTKYISWAELVLIHYLVPGASFTGHLAGILGGMVHVHLVAPAWPRLLRVLRAIHELLSGRHSQGWWGRGSSRVTGSRTSQYSSSQGSGASAGRHSQPDTTRYRPDRSGWADRQSGSDGYQRGSTSTHARQTVGHDAGSSAAPQDVRSRAAAAAEARASAAWRR